MKKTIYEMSSEERLKLLQSYFNPLLESMEHSILDVGYITGSVRESYSTFSYPYIPSSPRSIKEFVKYIVKTYAPGNLVINIVDLGSGTGAFLFIVSIILRKIGYSVKVKGIEAIKHPIYFVETINKDFLTINKEDFEHYSSVTTVVNIIYTFNPLNSSEAMISAMKYWLSIKSDDTVFIFHTAGIDLSMFNYKPIGILLYHIEGINE